MSAPVAVRYERPSDRAKRTFAEREGAPLFCADWRRVLFVHCRVDPAVLQPLVPFELDLFGGAAFVSLVAFTQRNLRPALGGRLGRLLCAPVSDHDFLNVRTYVRAGDESGIHFLVEWIPNRLATLLGPPLYGLPYRAGRLRYDFDEERRSYVGTVQTDRRLRFAAREEATMRPAIAEPDLLREFLTERYAAFTRRGRTPMRFRIWHEPWPQFPVKIEMPEVDLLDPFPWFRDAELIGATYSPGVDGVWIGRPRFA